MFPENQRRTFISYSRINKEFALKLARELRSSGFNIWLDQLDIPTGSRWDDEVELALETSDIFMVILTPASSKSDNVKDEIGYAIDTNKRILPILLENAKVPLRLRRFQYVDFTSKSYEEGVESAKNLLRRLIEEPTTPEELLPRVNQVEITKKEIAPPVREQTGQRGPSMADIQPETEKPAQQAKKKKLSAPLMIGLGVGAVAVLTVVAFLVGSMFWPTDPPTADDLSNIDTSPLENVSEQGSIPVSGDEACPIDSSQPVDIYIENATALTLDYYWIDQNCEEQYYGTIDAYGNVNMSTYVSYAWQFYDNQTGEFFFNYVADGEDYLQISGEVAAAGATGFTVGYVGYDGGEFNQVDQGLWLEKSFTNREEHYFDELDRDDWSVYLYDGERNLSVQLDLWTREIILDDNSGNEPFVLYAIATAE